MSESKVQVAVRIRPLLGKEKVERCTTCVDVLSDRELVMGGDKQFTFDYVFGWEIGQDTVYNRCVAPLVENLFDGYNATVLAYGQTGSGKTFTMGSGCSANIGEVESISERGMIPRATAHIFELIAEKRTANPDAEFYLRVQFLELYGETLRDLLDPVGTSQGKPVNIRDGPNNSPQVVGATEETVKSPSDMLALLEKGSLCRTTGSTDMNTHSSRSHAIFTIVLEQQLKPAIKDNDDAVTTEEAEYRTAKFHFVDLAGSERAKRTGATGQRMREGININMGLLALGNVISALGSEEGGTRFVRYRDSKLTRMLQDSLGGNSRTLMIACISPADVNFEETLNALRYANRTRYIKNKAIINRDPASSQIAALKAQITQLRSQIANGGGDGRAMYKAPDEAPDMDYRKRCSMLEEEVGRLAEAVDTERRIRLELESRFTVYEAERVALMGVSDTSAMSDESFDDTDSEDEDDKGSANPEQAGAVGEDMNNWETVKVPQSQGNDIKNEAVVEDEDDGESKALKHRFHKSQKALRKLFSTYDETLRSKEEAMKQIIEERAKYEALKTHFESKMAEMNEEVKETQAQREVLEAKLKELESEHQQTDSSRSEALKLRTLLAEKDKRLRDLEERTRQLNEARKQAAEWQKKESIVRSEIENVKREKVDLQRKMSENQKKHLDELRERRLEIAGLKRERARLEQDTNQLTARNERDTRMIQMKSEQVAAMQRKLREAQRLASHPHALSEREKKQRRELERLAALQVKREEELLDLRRALAKKEEAIARRDTLLEELKMIKNSTQPPPIKVVNQTEEEPIQSMVVQELVPDATEEDVNELEQRLEAADSEIMFRDRQCREVLQKDDGTSESLDADQLVLNLASLDQAKEVCSILLQMFVGSKRDLRQSKLELSRYRDQVAQQDQAVKMERKRTETLLHNSSPLKATTILELDNIDEELPLNEEEEEEVSVLFVNREPSTAAYQQDHSITPSKVNALNNFVSSEVKLKKFEAKLKSLRVDGEGESPVGASQSAITNNGNGGGGGGGSRRSSTIPVWDRLTSPSAATGIHKYGVTHRRISQAVMQQPAVDKNSGATEEEECVDEIIRIPRGRANNARASSGIPVSNSNNRVASSSEGGLDDEDQQQQNPSVGNVTSKFVSKMEALFAEAPVSPEKPKTVASVWERVTSQLTQSYSHKRFLDAEARRGSVPNLSSRRQTSPSRKAPPPPSILSASHKENSFNGVRPLSLSANDLRQIRKEHFASERARRRKQHSAPAMSSTTTSAFINNSNDDVAASTNGLHSVPEDETTA